MAPASTPPRDGPRETHRELLSAALDLFGRHGYDGVTTRMLAEAAATNVSSIKYHFGGKDELYVATLDEIIAVMRPRALMVREIAAHARDLAAADPVRQARLVRQVVDALVAVFLTQPEVRRFVPVVLRELLVPGRHFERIYEAVPRVLHETLTELVAWITASDAAAPAVIVRTHALIGSLLVFVIGRPILVRRLHVDDPDDDYDDALIDTIRAELTALMLRALDLPLAPRDEPVGSGAG